MDRKQTNERAKTVVILGRLRDARWLQLPNMSAIDVIGIGTINTQNVADAETNVRSSATCPAFQVNVRPML